MQTNPLAIHLLTATLAISLAACGASEPAPAPTPAGAPQNEATPTSSDALTMCKQVFTRQRDCGDEFLPALVALRVRLDIPEGITATDAAEGRESLLAKAREEYAVDSQDDAIAATCNSIVTSTPAEELEALKPAAGECLAAATCGDFVPCVIGLIEPQLTRGR